MRDCALGQRQPPGHGSARHVTRGRSGPNLDRCTVGGVRFVTKGALADSERAGQPRYAFAVIPSEAAQRRSRGIAVIPPEGLGSWR